MVRNLILTIYKFLSKPFLILSLPVVLATGCTTVTTSSEYSGITYTVKADASDKISIDYYDKDYWRAFRQKTYPLFCFDTCDYPEYCVDLCFSEHPLMYSEYFNCKTQNECEYRVRKVTYTSSMRYRGDIIDGTTISYRVVRNEVVKDNSYKEVSLRAITRTETGTQDLISSSLGLNKAKKEIGPDANTYLSKPLFITVQFEDPVEYVSEYNQESIAGNLNRFNLVDTKKVSLVKNEYPIAYSCLNGTVRAVVKTYAYRNGTKAIVSEIMVYPNASGESEFDTRPYKKAIIEKLKKVIRD